MATMIVCRLDRMSWLLVCRDLGEWTPSAWPSRFRDEPDDTLTTLNDIGKFGMNPQGYAPRYELPSWPC